MKTYSTLKTLYGRYTKNTSTDNLTYGDTLINDGYRLILGSRDWSFLEVSRNMDSVAGQQTYDLPQDVIKLKRVSTVNGNIRYTPVEIVVEQEWDKLNRFTNIRSDITLNFYIKGQITTGKQIALYPIPATSITDFIQLTYKRSVPDLSTIEDYSTGTIVSITSGATALVGSGTSWNSSMVGCYVKINQVNSATTGDGLWYEIAAVPTTTSITLVNPYLGSTIAAGSLTYTIANLPFLPEEFQLLPVYYAAHQYWLTIGNDTERSAYFEKLYTSGVDSLFSNYANKNTSPVVSESIFQPPMANPNNYPMA